jgi:hypothetical protein
MAKLALSSKSMRWKVQKDKRVHVGAIKACRGKRCVAPLICNLDGSKWSLSRSGRFTAEK